jgi:CelD/BcsL family acetyltransferase involved in cellulose biosynthesis
MTAVTLSVAQAQGVMPPADVGIAATTLHVTTLDDVEAFDGLREEWNALLRASASETIFLTWEWMRAWWSHLSSGYQLRILTVRRGSELLAIAPLCSEGRTALGALRLSFLGTGRVGSDYLDVIADRKDEGEVVTALAAHLLEMGATLDLRQVRITSSTASRLTRELRRLRCPVRARRTHRCPFVDLGHDSFAAYLATLSSQHRANFQRKRRKLEGQHGFRFESVTTESRRRDLLPVLFELHRLRWTDRGGSDGLSGSAILEFHEDWSRLALARGWLRLFVLWLGETPAAALYGFRYGRVFSFYQSGFDPQFANLSVGVVAMGLSIQSALEDGASEFDLLHGQESYKFDWARGVRRLGRIQVFPRGPLGRLACAGSSLAQRARRAVRRLDERKGVRLVSTRAGGPA